MKAKKVIRQNFRDAVFNRDGHKCVYCDITDNLDAHHIVDRNEMPNGGYVVENGITLCQKHHMDAEEYHITGGDSWVDDMHPIDLFIKIKSTIRLAIATSEKLKL